MIIFCDKKTGAIVGRIGGRIHNEEHLNMWIGDKEKTVRIVIPWKQLGKKQTIERSMTDFKQIGIDSAGEAIYKKEHVIKKIVYREFLPDHPQGELIENIEKGKIDINNYKIDLKTKRLIPNG